MRLAKSLSPVALAGALACGSGGGGAGPPPPCTAGAPCTPANPCRVGAIACTTGSPVCQETGAIALDGVSCGANAVCSSGACVDRSTTRTVAGKFQTVYRSDDGSMATVAEPPRRHAVVAGIVVPDGSVAGYARFPVTVGADGAFSVSGVPVGRWFLQLDGDVFVPDAARPPNIVRAVATQLIPLASGTPDLTTVLAARPDLTRVSASTPVTADVSNLEPWVSGARLIVASAQADVNEWPTLVAAPPAPGSTAFTSQFDWQYGFGPRSSGLPDPAKGDVVFWYQRHAAPLAIPAGTGTVRRVVRYARLDTLGIRDGVPVRFSVPLVEAPQTGMVSLDVGTTALLRSRPT
jgi:hypothetical protein